MRSPLKCARLSSDSVGWKSPKCSRIILILAFSDLQIQAATSPNQQNRCGPTNSCWTLVSSIFLLVGSVCEKISRANSWVIPWNKVGFRNCTVFRMTSFHACFHFHLKWYCQHVQSHMPPGAFKISSLRRLSVLVQRQASGQGTQAQPTHTA